MDITSIKEMSFIGASYLGAILVVFLIVYSIVENDETVFLIASVLIGIIFTLIGVGYYYAVKTE